MRRRVNKSELRLRIYKKKGFLLVLECLEYPGEYSSVRRTFTVVLKYLCCDSSKVKARISHLLFKYLISEWSVSAPTSFSPAGKWRILSGGRRTSRKHRRRFTLQEHSSMFVCFWASTGRTAASVTSVSVLLKLNILRFLFLSDSLAADQTRQCI